MKEPTAQVRWEGRTQNPLLVLAVAFGVAYAVPVVAPDAQPWAHALCMGVEWVVWAAFAADYAVRLYLAPSRWFFVRAHWLDLLAVLLPLIQPLRLLRLVSTLLLVGNRARMASQVRLTTYVAGSVVGLMMFGSLAVLQVERDAPDGNIKTLGDAVWWSFTTMTTVGYGDHAPKTGLGRLLAVGLMLAGIALLGVVTANIAAWFVARFERDDAEERRRTAVLEALTREVRELRAEVARLSGDPSAVVTTGIPPGPSGPPVAATGPQGSPVPGQDTGPDVSSPRS
ncbi:potassium channel family protein [Streptomyces sp. TRM76323]|uniref:Potassium channel family protein n=1 Tax=Streptomyces tamarix TaxID=3078565 RepID=A0ABU3QQV9_9ACTN|nr:potassium channel family protein [Streptomyces tamarix]MDT9684883.1 potassium channel family protein [Streptomyces tamarix]